MHDDYYFIINLLSVCLMRAVEPPAFSYWPLVSSPLNEQWADQNYPFTQLPRQLSEVSEQFFLSIACRLVSDLFPIKKERQMSMTFFFM